MVGKARAGLEEGTRGRKRGRESDNMVRGRDERETALWRKRERRVAEVTERDGDVLIW